jgi:hypothetical protein
MIEVNAVTKMEEDPPQVSYRRDLQTTLRCFPEKCWEVLNGIGKKSGWTDYVRLEKMNESEPSMRCRENEHPVKTTVHLLRRKSVAENLFTGYVAGVIEEA